MKLTNKQMLKFFGYIFDINNCKVYINMLCDN